MGADFSRWEFLMHGVKDRTPERMERKKVETANQIIIVNLVNHHKDPYQTTRIQWRVRVFAGVFSGLIHPP